MPRDHVILATAHYPPASIGGTEVYVSGLAAALRGKDVPNLVLTPQEGPLPVDYGNSSSPVETYPAAPDEQGLASFRALLDQRRDSIYHQHTWTTGCGAPHLRMAKQLGLRTVLTIHVPGVTCLSGTMLRDGNAPCDGRVAGTACARCWTLSRGASEHSATALAHVPQLAAGLFRKIPGRAFTALAARAIVAERQQMIAAMLRDADRIVAVCQWLHDALALNGVPREKLVLCRQGLPADDLHRLAQQVARPRQNESSLRLLMLGRFDPVKGLHTAVEAMRKVPADLDILLDIHAAEAPQHQAYAARVKDMAAADPRIRFHAPLDRMGVAARLAGSDALLVPSVWMETGPLVVLEALAAGLCVLGSNRGGIAELIGATDHGECLPVEDPQAWAEAITRLARRKSAGGLPGTPRPVRAMEDVAADMLEVYAAL